VLGSTKDGNLELYEDNIGLHAKATITDKEVIEEARANKLQGWSFGFTTNDDEWEDTEDGMQRRTLKDIELREVSILTATPAYIATSIEMRGEDCTVIEERLIEEIPEVIEHIEALMYTSLA
jgi:HK97 family phage prohead protease